MVICYADKKWEMNGVYCSDIYIFVLEINEKSI